MNGKETNYKESPTRRKFILNSLYAVTVLGSSCSIYQSCQRPDIINEIYDLEKTTTKGGETSPQTLTQIELLYAKKHDSIIGTLAALAVAVGAAWARYKIQKNDPSE